MKRVKKAIVVDGRTADEREMRVEERTAAACVAEGGRTSCALMGGRWWPRTGRRLAPQQRGGEAHTVAGCRRRLPDWAARARCWTRAHCSLSGPLLRGRRPPEGNGGGGAWSRDAYQICRRRRWWLGSAPPRFFHNCHWSLPSGGPLVAPPFGPMWGGYHTRFRRAFFLGARRSSFVLFFKFYFDFDSIFGWLSPSINPVCGNSLHLEQINGLHRNASFFICISVKYGNVAGKKKKRKKCRNADEFARARMRQMIWMAPYARDRNLPRGMAKLRKRSSWRPRAGGKGWKEGCCSSLQFVNRRRAATEKSGHCRCGCWGSAGRGQSSSAPSNQFHCAMIVPLTLFISCLN